LPVYKIFILSYFFTKTQSPEISIFEDVETDFLYSTNIKTGHKSDAYGDHK